MNLDKSLQAFQYQHELQAFLRYEQRLKEAYARSQNPFPGRWQPHGHRGGVQINSEQSSSCPAQDQPSD